MVNNISNFENILNFNFSCLIVCFILVTLVLLQVFIDKKKNIHSLNNEHIQYHLTRYIFGNSEECKESLNFFSSILINGKQKQILIDKLIEAKKLYSGHTLGKLNNLYKECKLDVFSIKKANSFNISKKVEGCKELALLGEDKYLQCTNYFFKKKRSKKISLEYYIRTNGFLILEEYSNSTNTISKWDQIVILNSLPSNEFNTKKEYLNKLLFSENITLVVLILKIFVKNNELPEKTSISYLENHKVVSIRKLIYQMLNQKCFEINFEIIR